MAQTSTPVSACNVVIYLEDSGETPRDISGSSNRVVIAAIHTLGDHHAYGSKWPKRLDAGKDITFTLTVLYTTTSNEGMDILKKWYFAASPGARALRLDIPDSTVGSDRYSGDVRLDDLKWTISAREGGPILVTARLLPDGEITRTTIE